MPKRAVVMFTDMYPYDTGEEFIEQEIDRLASAFDKVLIVPMRASSTAIQTRQLPTNAQSLLLPPSSIPSWQKRALRMMPRILWGHARMVENTPWGNFGRFGMDVRFASIALDARDRFVSVFPWYELDDVDEVVLYSYWFFTGAAIAGMIRHRELTGRKVVAVARAHAYDVDEKDAPRGYIPSRSFVMNAVDKVYPISDYAASFLQRRFPDTDAKIEVRRLGVPPAGSVSRVKPETIRIATCSHLAPYKRVWLTGDAVAELEKRGYQVEWTHIGERSTDLRQNLLDSIKEKAPHSTVSFVGYMSNADVRAFYAHEPLTAFVNSSDGEGVPVSIMEAQANSLPVVATDAGGTREIVWDKKNGRVVPVSITGKELADAIEWVHQRTESEYQQLCESAGQTWAQMSDARRQYDEFVDGLIALCNERLQ